VGHGFRLAAELLLGAAWYKSRRNHVETPFVFASRRWPEGQRPGKSPAPHLATAILLSERRRYRTGASGGSTHFWTHHRDMPQVHMTEARSPETSRLRCAEAGGTAAADDR